MVRLNRVVLEPGGSGSAIGACHIWSCYTAWGEWQRRLLELHPADQHSFQLESLLVLAGMMQNLWDSAVRLLPIEDWVSEGALSKIALDHSALLVPYGTFAAHRQAHDP